MAYMFSFSSIARTIQVRLLCGADVEHLPELDRKYWLMLSCAVSAMGSEGEAVARALDIDGAGRVRVPEVLAAPSPEDVRLFIHGSGRAFGG